MILNEKMSILELIQLYPQTVDVFQNYGMGCLGCCAASFESIGQGAAAHCINLEVLTADFNKAIEGQVCSFCDQ